MFDLPHRLALIWQCWAWSSACTIAASYTPAPRPRPVTQTRAAIEAEIAAAPVAETWHMPKASAADEREAKRMARAIKYALSESPDTRARGEAALRRIAETTSKRKRRSS